MDISRRRALALLPAATAAVSIPAAAHPSTDDAELIQMGNELRERYETLIRLSAERRRLYPVWQAECAKRGVPWRDHAATAIVAHDTGFDAAASAEGDLELELWALGDRIEALPASTLAGVAAHTLAALCRLDDDKWKAEAHKDYSVAKVLRLLRTVEAAAGLPPVLAGLVSGEDDTRGELLA